MIMSTSCGKILSDEEILTRARENLNERPERLKEDINAIKDWIKKQPHLGPNARQDDTFILAYLRGCKFSFERAKAKIDTYHTLKTHCPEFFDNWDPMDKDLFEILKQGPSIPLRGYDKHGRKVLLIRNTYLDYSSHKLTDIIKASLMMNETLMLEGDRQAHVTGLVLVNDVGGPCANMDMVAQMTPSFAKKAITVFQDGYPANPKENHMVNLPPIMEKVIQLFMTFSNKKMKERTRFYAKGVDYSKLHEAVGKDVLPEEYGGNAGPIQEQIGEMLEKVLANKDHLKVLASYKTNEKKRPGKEKLYSDIFGMEGSFRKLEFD